MTYQEFKNKYNGKYVDYDGAYGAQCWDLGQKYFIEVLGLPAGVLGGVGLVSGMLYGEKRKLMDQYFDKVPTNAMHAGDVCIWEYGHIAIFDNWDGVKCNYFSQNPNPAQVLPIYAGGLHAFRRKGTSSSSSSTSSQSSSNTYVVKAGDTGYAIAAKLGYKWDDIVKLNNLTNNGNLLSIGQVLKLPSKATSTDNKITNGSNVKIKTTAQKFTYPAGVWIDGSIKDKPGKAYEVTSSDALIYINNVCMGRIAIADLTKI